MKSGFAKKKAALVAAVCLVIAAAFGYLALMPVSKDVAAKRAEKAPGQPGPFRLPESGMIAVGVDFEIDASGTGFIEVSELRRSGNEPIKVYSDGDKKQKVIAWLYNGSRPVKPGTSLAEAQENEREHLKLTTPKDPFGVDLPVPVTAVVPFQ